GVQQDALHQRAVLARGGTADAGERPERLRRRRRDVRRPTTEEVAGARGDVRPDPLAQRTELRRVGYTVTKVLARQSSSAERDRPRDVGLLVGTARDLQRSATDVEHRQSPGRPPEPPAY